MARRGRPRSARAANAHIVRLKLRLYPGEDDDLIAYFETIPTGLRSITVKRALRDGAPMQGATNNPEEDVQDILDAFLL